MFGEIIMMLETTRDVCISEAQMAEECEGADVAGAVLEKQEKVEHMIEIVNELKKLWGEVYG